MEKYRSLFPITSKFTFLNHAATAPTSLRVINAISTLFQNFGSFGGLHYTKWTNRIQEVRTLFAKLINAEPNEIAFVGNTSEALSLIASGIDWNSGDVVLVPAPEFPANVYPWMNLEKIGVKVSFITRRNGIFGVKDVEQVLTPKVKLLSVSSVDFSTGFRCNLEELGRFCQRKGILFCVDAIQSLGIIPMDVKKFGIHFLATGGHKWLLSTLGIGALYISRSVNDLLHPNRIGWKSVVNEEDFSHLHFDLKPDALRFEAGTMNISGIYALGIALELLFEAGIQHIQKKIFEINSLLYKGLRKRKVTVISSMHEEHRSGILSFIPPGDTESLFNFLIEKNIIVSVRNGNIRISPHFYNNDQDISNFFDSLDRYAREY